MSIERPFGPWEEFHRHGQDLADRLAQGFTGLIAHPPSFKNPFDIETLLSFSASPSFPAVMIEFPAAAADGVSAILDIGDRVGQAGLEFGACLSGMVQQFFWKLPMPFRSESPPAASASEIRIREVSRRERSEEADDEEFDFDERISDTSRRARILYFRVPP